MMCDNDILINDTFKVHDEEYNEFLFSAILCNNIARSGSPSK